MYDTACFAGIAWPASVRVRLAWYVCGLILILFIGAVLMMQF